VSNSSTSLAKSAKESVAHQLLRWRKYSIMDNTRW
jgi:hypothetical protein